jgi:hypothetical protein
MIIISDVVWHGQYIPWNGHIKLHQVVLPLQNNVPNGKELEEWAVDQQTIGVGCCPFICDASKLVLRNFPR